MLEHLQGKTSERKRRLFAVGCCRSIWPLLGSIGKEAVEYAKQRADGMVTAEELARMENLSWWGADGLNYEDDPVWFAGWAAYQTTQGDPTQLRPWRRWQSTIEVLICITPACYRTACAILSGPLRLAQRV